jgi:hypothetical protein
MSLTAEIQLKAFQDVGEALFSLSEIATFSPEPVFARALIRCVPSYLVGMATSDEARRGEPKLWVALREMCWETFVAVLKEQRINEGCLNWAATKTVSLFQIS